MNKLLSFYLILLYGFWQLQGQQLPNMDFEDWTFDPLSKSKSNLSGNWQTGNGCSVEYLQMGDPDTLCYIFSSQNPDAISGKSSIKLMTPPDVPPGTGFLTTYDPNEGHQFVKFGFVPSGLQVSYKYFKGKPTDEALITVNFYNDDFATVLYGVKSIINESNTWATLKVDLSKIPPTATPQYVELIFNHTQQTLGYTPSIDTYLMLDNMKFLYTTNMTLDQAFEDGLENLNGTLDFSKIKNVKDISVVDLHGRIIKKIDNSFDTKTLNAGIYVFSYQKDDLLHSFKFPITGFW